DEVVVNDADGVIIDEATVLLIIKRGVEFDTTGVIDEFELSDDDKISEREFKRSFINKTK
ncbi:unnamed protein product, partial [Rotaria magnacalcarata]